MFTLMSMNIQRLFVNLIILVKIRFILFETKFCSLLRDLFHVYLNKFEFHFLLLHINNINKFCFFIYNGRVPGIAK